jgi:hypothetical protein
MSWDATLAKTSDPNFARPAEDAKLLPMGKPADVRAALNATIPGIDWSHPPEGHVFMGDFSLEFYLTGKTPFQAGSTTIPNVSESDDVESVSVSARGSGDPISALVAVAKANHWSLADAQEGTWMDLNSPSQKSWENFTAFRDRVSARVGIVQPKPMESRSVGTNLLISAAVILGIILVMKYLPKLFRGGR